MAQSKAMGSALLWNAGHYNFGNADKSSAANANSYGDALLQTAQDRQAKLQSNAASTNPDVLMLDEENSLLNKKKKRRPPYDENFLFKDNGLAFILRHFGDIPFKGAGHERRDLALLLENYKEWAFAMYPAMNFKDIVARTQSFSSKASVKGHLQRLRDRRDGVGDDVEEEEAAEEEDVDMAGQPNEIEVLERRPDDDGQLQVSQPITNEPILQRPQQRGPPMGNIDPMGFGGDPMDMMHSMGGGGMDFGGDPDEDDIARQMYG